MIALVHGSSTAGGAYMTGLSDDVIMVRGRAKAFLAGPPLLKAATGEIATDEELGGAEMHSSVSGLGEYLAEDDADALRVARDLLQRLQWGASGPPSLIDADSGARAAVRRRRVGRSDAAGLPHADRHARGHCASGRSFASSPSSALTTARSTLCGHAALYGQPIGIVTNNGPIDPAGANKATHFIQRLLPGRHSAAVPAEHHRLHRRQGQRARRHDQARLEDDPGGGQRDVPHITLMCGASFGAGNYGMCGRAFGPRFVFTGPTLAPR